MLSALARVHPIVERTFQEASDMLGFDLWRLTQDGPAELLNLTENTQPAMLAAGAAVWRVWQEQGGPAPGWMAGHSLGEYTALVCSGGLNLSDAVALVARRGRLMQEAVPDGEGAMAAILGLEDDRVVAVCQVAAEGQVVEAVNFNSPGQVVIAGNRAAVERAMVQAKAAGAKRALRIPVSVPSHCALMRPAALGLVDQLHRAPIRPPTIPVIHNASVGVSTEPDEIRDLLDRQLYSPVRWVETIRRMAAEGASSIVEAGPGRVLAGLVKRIDRNLNALSIHDPDSLNAVMGALNAT
jgi:[acyl-carrier-protein] S-malonyltransferase